MSRTNDEEIAYLKARLFYANEALERAYCGVLFSQDSCDPNYGWPIGDQVPETMADAIIAEHRSLERRLAELKARYEGIVR